jgi:hypothetical protein
LLDLASVMETLRELFILGSSLFLSCFFCILSSPFPNTGSDSVPGWSIHFSTGVTPKT